MKPRIGLPALFAAVALATAGPGRADAAAISYAVQILGPVTNDDQPDASNYRAPLVSNSGSLSYGSVGPLSVGGYSETYGYYGPGQSIIQYNAPGSTSIELALGGRESDSAHQHDYATGVSDNGFAIGFRKVTAGTIFDPESSSTAFVYRPGRPTASGQGLPGLSVVPGIVPGTAAWFALGVNASGMIVGQAPDSASAKLSLFGDFNSGHYNTGPIGRAFVSDGTTSTDLNTLIGPNQGFLLTAATSINDQGQITALGVVTDGPDQGIYSYLLTPTATPEPSTLAIALTAAGCLGLRRIGLRRRDRK